VAVEVDGHRRDAARGQLLGDEAPAPASVPGTVNKTVTVHCNVAVRIGAAARQVAEEARIVFSPWHPAAVPSGPEGEPFHAAIDPIAQRHGATAQQIALAWQLHRTKNALPIPGTTSVEHLHENLAAANIHLASTEVEAITALAAEED
jgi:aryl-alcohol dehydrogenase-like predicted oxidoreductase